jgi:hypothetical protein
MPMTWVVAAYGASAVLALLVLFFKGAKAWYWHVLSVAAALVLGLTPIPPNINTPTTSLIVGTIFTFLLLWGIAAPFVGRCRK